MKIEVLDFSTPNNACLSLHMLAEWARTGAVKAFEISPLLVDGGGMPTLEKAFGISLPAGSHQHGRV